MSIQDNIEKIKKEIGNNYVVVIKNRSLDEVSQVLSSGINIVGENRIQEAVEHFSKLDFSNVKKHFIGHLQSRKATDAVSMFDVIQTVDSEKLLIKIDQCAKDLNKVQEIYIQINISNDENKYGMSADQLSKMLTLCRTLQNVTCTGLMAILKQYNSDDETEQDMSKMKDVFEQYKDDYSLEILSMGMSNDYKLAIKYGANLVRLGRIIYT